ncbi:hypothetical protein ACWCWD_01385 [Streptomyces sp. NPDC001493]
MDGAVIGLIGTVVGAVSGVVGTRTATRLGGSEQRRTQNDQSERQGRTSAYSTLATACSRAYRVGRAAHVVLQGEGARRPSDMTEALQQFGSAVEEADEAVDVVKLLGPDLMARAADNLMAAMNLWRNEVELLARGRGDEQCASEAIEMCEELAERFVVLGRETLSGTAARP